MRSWMDIKEEVLVSKIDLLNEQIKECTNTLVKTDLINMREKYKREFYRWVERKERHLRYEDNTR